MGIEAFGVSMRFVEPGAFEQLRNTLKQYPGLQLDREQTAAGFITIIGEYSDGAHFIDIQLACEIASDSCTLAVRFSLCSYDSIDTVFIKMITEVLSSMKAEVWLMSSAAKTKTNCLPGDTCLLATVLPDEIVGMRKYWQNLFGAKQGVVRVKDSFSFVGAIK